MLALVKNPDEPETRDKWWLEVREEIRSHCRVLGCSVVIGYSESTTICDELVVYSATGTAAVLDFAAVANTLDSLYRLNFATDRSPLRAATGSGGLPRVDNPPATAPAVADGGGGPFVFPVADASGDGRASSAPATADSFSAAGAAAQVGGHTVREQHHELVPVGSSLDDSNADAATPAAASDGQSSLPLPLRRKLSSHDFQGSASPNASTPASARRRSVAHSDAVYLHRLRRRALARMKRCAICHVPYKTSFGSALGAGDGDVEAEVTGAPLPMRIVSCGVCKKHWVPEVLFCTVEPPPELQVRSQAPRWQVLQAIARRGCVI